MGTIAVAVIVFTCSFGGTMAEVALRRRRPLHHLGDDSKRLMNRGIILVWRSLLV